MKVDETNYEILQRISDITKVEYEIKWFDAEDIDGYVDTNIVLAMLEDMICEVDRLKEELEGK